MEPSPELQDVGKFEEQQIPFSARFWVGSVDGRIIHSCPLIETHGYILKLDDWSIDKMHTWVLGPLQLYISFAIHFFLATFKIWAGASPQWLDAQQQQQLALNAIKSKLLAYYEKQRRENPDWRTKGTQVCVMLKWGFLQGGVGSPEVYTYTRHWVPFKGNPGPGVGVYFWAAWGSQGGGTWGKYILLIGASLLK